MVTYYFKLIESQVPVIKGKNIIQDSNVGGTKNTYKIYLVRNICGIRLNKYIGTKSFLRPYKSMWDVKERRLPSIYWGNGPLLNLWLVLNTNYNNIKDMKVFVTENNTLKRTVEVFNIRFKSKDLTKNLKSNESFKQSKFYEDGRENIKK